jgi:hypothetical protein
VDEVRVYFDQSGNSLTVWFAEPKTEHVGEEIEATERSGPAGRAGL